MTSAPVRSGIKEGKPDADTSGRRPLNKRLSAEFQSVKMVIITVPPISTYLVMGVYLSAGEIECSSCAL